MVRPKLRHSGGEVQTGSLTNQEAIDNDVN